MVRWQRRSDLLDWAGTVVRQDQHVWFVDSTGTHRPFTFFHPGQHVNLSDFQHILADIGRSEDWPRNLLQH